MNEALSGNKGRTRDRSSSVGKSFSNNSYAFLYSYCIELCTRSKEFYRS